MQTRRWEEGWRRPHIQKGFKTHSFPSDSIVLGAPELLSPGRESFGSGILSCQGSPFLYSLTPSPLCSPKFCGKSDELWLSATGWRVMPGSQGRVWLGSHRLCRPLAFVRGKSVKDLNSLPIKTLNSRGIVITLQLTLGE